MFFDHCQNTFAKPMLIIIFVKTTSNKKVGATELKPILDYLTPYFSLKRVELVTIRVIVNDSRRMVFDSVHNFIVA